MQIHNLQQGSAQWHAHRAQHFNASDAPAMMGCSPYKTRSQLLHELCSGIVPEVDPETQRRFDEGHRAEALARPLAEKIIGEELFPCVGTEGKYSASFDGLTMAEDVAFEHKLLGRRLREVMSDGMAGAELPLDYRVQMEQQMLVSGAGNVLFMASEWAADGTLIEERHCWYVPDAELRAAILNGWAQFERDLAEYVPPQHQQPKPIGATPETLPALRIEVTGMVTASNLDAFKAHAMKVFDGIKTELQTDQDFADAEATVKFLKDVRDRLVGAKQHALSQTETIDLVFRTIDDLIGVSDAKRLTLEKLVKAEKDARRQEIADAAHKRYVDRVLALNGELRGVVTLGIPAALRADIGEAMKGKRTVDTLRDAADTLVAGALAELQALADRYRANHAAMGELRHLVPDFASVGAKAPEDFTALLQLRQHQHAEAEREAAARAETERLAAEREAQRLAEAQRQAQAASELAAAKQSQEGAALSPEAQKLYEAEGAAKFAKAHPAIAQAPAADEPATLPLGELCSRLQFTVTADFLQQLGFTAQRDGSRRLYRESQFPAVCDALVAHIARQRQTFSRNAARAALA